MIQTEAFSAFGAEEEIICRNPVFALEMIQTIMLFLNK